MSDSNSGGTSILGLLGVLFVGLKLGGVINWSWWYVTLPFWSPAAFVLIGLSGFLFMLIIIPLLTKPEMPS